MAMRLTDAFCRGAMRVERGIYNKDRSGRCAPKAVMPLHNKGLHGTQREGSGSLKSIGRVPGRPIVPCVECQPP